MKLLPILALLLLSQSDWSLVVSLPTESVYCNPKSISRTNNTVKAWSKILYSPIQKGVAERRDLIQFDCSNHTAKAISFITYDSEGSVLENYDFLPNTKPYNIAPDTVGSATLDFVCRQPVR